MVQKPEVERAERQDNPNVDRQPRPEVASEEQHVNADYHSGHRDHVQHADC